LFASFWLQSTSSKQSVIGDEMAMCMMHGHGRFLLATESFSGLSAVAQDWRKTFSCGFRSGFGMIGAHRLIGIGDRI
jgi:hypothetical protein